MSGFVDLLPQQMPGTVEEPGTVAEWPAESCAPSPLWSLESFAKEQIRGLVRQLFSPSRAPLRQVVFSAVDPPTEVMPICLQVGNALGQHSSGSVCVVEAFPHGLQPGTATQDRCRPSSAAKHFGGLRELSQEVSNGLWFMPASVFWGGSHDTSTEWMRARLAELRLDFDYSVLCGPAVVHDEAAALGSLSDGLVMVLQANFTRRLTAQKAKERLSSANARLLGTVLTGRLFPIPEAIYRRV